MQDGLLLIDKPAGCTSHDVVMSVRKILGQKKIGHCGTLDPDATGLLLLTLGRATRLTRFLIRAPKVYEGTLRLGVSTDTYDLSGEVTAQKAADQVSIDEVDTAAQSFVGSYLQVPPPYCAKKVGGVKFYELARRGEKVPETKKEVTVFELRRLGDLEPVGETRSRDLAFLLSSSSGTYARSIVHDLGEKLGCGATLAALRRTQIGEFKVTSAIGVEALRKQLVDDAERDLTAAEVGGSWVPFDDIRMPFDEIVADQQQERRIRNGQTVLIRDLASREGDWLKVTNQRRQFIAVGAVVECIGSGGVGVIQPKVVFH